MQLASIHGSGNQRLTLSAAGNIVDLRCAPALDTSFELVGHGARVSGAAVLAPVGGGGGSMRIGVVTASHDQTVRCVCVHVSGTVVPSTCCPALTLRPYSFVAGCGLPTWMPRAAAPWGAAASAAPPAYSAAHSAWRPGGHHLPAAGFQQWRVRCAARTLKSVQSFRPAACHLANDLADHPLPTL